MTKKEIINSSLFLSFIYTVGHIIIAMICNTLITGANINLAALDALIEPCINGVWFYILHKIYKYFSLSTEISS
tara:strand:+ start:374 stop:595 length:222 start_codon:yes stop_codon:yes gene_type:complete